jgi:hypothetical protein
LHGAQCCIIERAAVEAANYWVDARPALNPTADKILSNLQEVQAERSRRAADAGLAASVAEVKRFQHARFSHTYADLLANPRYREAARFFLDDLYGPADFSQRDAQFVRVVPALVRLFPAELVETVLQLAQLHALSERLDSAMGAALAGEPLDGRRYGQAWRLVGEPASRSRQIDLMLAVGRALDRYTRSLFLRNSLRLMRGPAQAAGLGALQGFLESGFDTFKAMRGAEAFLGVIEQRERALAAQLFAGADAELGGGGVAAASGQPP